MPLVHAQEPVPLNILFASSEAYPLVKTGGLADVAGALPIALAKAGIGVRLILPAYPEVLGRANDITTVAEFPGMLAGHDVRLLAARMPDSDLPLLLVECPALFERAGGPYTDDAGNDWPDNHLRFAIFSLTAAWVAAGAAGETWRADILHANDWQTGLAPAYLRFIGAPNTRSVFTIHNMRYQGLFPRSVMGDLEVPRFAFTMEGMEFHGQVSMLKAGLAFADRIATVSPTYADEILLPEFGYGMEGLLSARRRDLTGILNGIDETAWNPLTDRHLPAHFDSGDLTGKAVCKMALQQEMGLTEDPDSPLLTMVTRLTEQKGIDLVVSALPEMIGMGAQIAILGAGDAHWEHALRDMQAPHGRVAARIGYDEALAHRLVAGADMFLMPSRFEPCGLTQMYAMRYGTLPVVNRTGGLADTVMQAQVAASGNDASGTGFVFEMSKPGALAGALQQGVALHKNKAAWLSLQRCAMHRDFSWARAADDYGWIYRTLAPHAVASSANHSGETA